MVKFSELLSEEDRKKSEQWAAERLSPKHKTEIPPEFYTIAELGYYYGWGAVEAFYRGYIEDWDEKGNRIKLAFPLSKAMGFIKAAKKFNYRRIVDEGDIMAAANISSRDTNYAKNAVKYSNKVRQTIDEE